MTEVTIGVDISKDHLDVHLLPDGIGKRFANTAAGCHALTKWLSDRPVARIVFEPTGPYHRLFERTLGREGLPLAKVNPRQASALQRPLARSPRLIASTLRCLPRWVRSSAPPYARQEAIRSTI